MADDWPKQKRWSNRPRLGGFRYDGEHAYHLVFNTAHHKPLLVGKMAAEAELAVQAAATSTSHQLLAYVIMPNHIHALVQGEHPDSDAVKFVQSAKQRPGYLYKQETGGNLWLPSFYDRTVRRGDDAKAIANYIWENPIRSGLISRDERWPHLGGTLLEQEARRS